MVETGLLQAIGAADKVSHCPCFCGAGLAGQQQGA